MLRIKPPSTSHCCSESVESHAATYRKFGGRPDVELNRQRWSASSALHSASTTWLSAGAPFVRAGAMEATRFP